MTKPPILLAPDKFKGSFSAAEVAEALAAGVRDAGGVPRLMPIADGGEGLGVPCDAVIAVDDLTDHEQEWLGLGRIVEARTWDELRAAGETLG
ncbi:MAG: glycerate kinase [Solirubrobacterales bacterium]